MAARRTWSFSADCPSNAAIANGSRSFAIANRCEGGACVGRLGYSSRHDMVVVVQNWKTVDWDVGISVVLQSFDRRWHGYSRRGAAAGWLVPFRMTAARCIWRGHLGLKRKPFFKFPLSLPEPVGRRGLGSPRGALTVGFPSDFLSDFRTGAAGRRSVSCLAGPRRLRNRSNGLASFCSRQPAVACFFWNADRNVGSSSRVSTCGPAWRGLWLAFVFSSPSSAAHRRHFFGRLWGGAATVGRHRKATPLPSLAPPPSQHPTRRVDSQRPTPNEWGTRKNKRATVGRPRRMCGPCPGVMALLWGSHCYFLCWSSPREAVACRVACKRSRSTGY